MKSGWAILRLFQNVMNRMFLSMPRATNPVAATTFDTAVGPRNGLLTGGYGFVNTINGLARTPPRPNGCPVRSDFIVSRKLIVRKKINLVWSKNSNCLV